RPATCAFSRTWRGRPPRCSPTATTATSTWASSPWPGTATAGSGSAAICHPPRRNAIAVTATRCARGISGVAVIRVWQVDLERGAGALAAILDPGPAAVELGEHAHQRQPDPHARRVRGGPGPLAEWLEDRLPQRLGHPWAGILDDQQGTVVPGLHMHPHGRAGRRVL